MLTSPLASDSKSFVRAEIFRAGRIILSSSGGLSPSNKLFHDARYRLYSIAAAAADRNLVRELHEDPELREMTARIFPVSCEAGIHEECAIAERLLAEERLTFGRIFRSYHGEVYEALMMDEIRWLEAGGVSMAGQHIAYIGGGAMPIPAMLLAQRLGCRVTIVDPHRPSCDLAEMLIARVGLSHLVDICRMAGEAADYSDFSMVYMANWIKGKQPIFRRIHEFSNVAYVIARSAAQDSLSFVINDEIDPANIDAQAFEIAHITAKRPEISLVSMIMRTIPAAQDAPAAMRAPASPAVSRRVVSSMTELIGNTPTLLLDPAKTGLKNIDLYAKLEHLNPFGSIKDRTAFGMIGPHVKDIAAKGMSVLELSSGNAARGLQAIASMNGTHLETVSGRIRSAEMRKILQLQGARITPIDHLIDPSDAYSSLNIVDGKASRESDRYFYTDQYRNPANDGTHYSTTGREIVEDIGAVDYMIGSVGTAGSTIGISRALKEANPALDIIGVLSEEKDYVPGIRHQNEVFNVGPFNEKYYKELIPVTALGSIDGLLDLIREYGIMAGPSSGATYKAALDYLRGVDGALTERKKAVFVVCDRVELYLGYIQERRPDLFL